MMYGKGAGPTTANSIVFDLGLVLSDYRQKFMPSFQFACIGNKYRLAKYIVKVKSDFPKEYIEKSLGDMGITKKISGEELERLKPYIDFYARIME